MAPERCLFFASTRNLYFHTPLHAKLNVALLNSSTTSASLSGIKRSGSREDGKGKSMEKAYEEYFNSLAEGEEALSFAEFKEALS